MKKLIKHGHDLYHINVALSRTQIHLCDIVTGPAKMD